jgi:acetyltransferase-like isoleucine patch superfamily enzyme
MNIAKIVTTIIRENIVSKFVKPSGRANVQIGAYTYGNPRVVTTHNGKVIIGRYCSIADDVLIIGDNHSFRRVANFPLPWWLENIKKIPFQKPNDSFEQRRELPIEIGNDVWIGAGAIILPEVKIGDGAIVGAGAVVTHDVPAYAIVVGVPAKILRYQFTQNQIDQLESIAWWNWNDGKIVENIEKFYGDVDEFIKEFGSFSRHKSK